jgi:hypothetical protein
MHFRACLATTLPDVAVVPAKVVDDDADSCDACERQAPSRTCRIARVDSSSGDSLIAVDSNAWPLARAVCGLCRPASRRDNSRMRVVRGGFVCAAVLTLGFGLGGGTSLAVVGGQAIPIHAAPWAVVIKETFPHGEHGTCSGSIIDRVHVVTAAHCLFSSNGDFAVPEHLVVEAGVSNFRHPNPRDAKQQRTARSLRVDPGYVNRAPPSDSDTAHDVAVLTLSRPLRLGGRDIRAVALPQRDMRFPAGAGILAGFGQQSPARPGSGALRWLRSRLLSPRLCELRGVVCASAITGAACSGDSGAGLVLTSPEPLLVGVMSAVVDRRCPLGVQAEYVYVNAASTWRFLHGHSAPGAPPLPPAKHWTPAGWLTVRSTYHGQEIPLEYAVPRAWVDVGPGSGITRSRLGAQAENTTSPHPGSKAKYYAEAEKRIRGYYRKLDRHATIRTQPVELPGARALEIVTNLRERINGRMRPVLVLDYLIFHEGVGYNVAYGTPGSVQAIAIPVFEKSARTIHFNG